LKTRKEILNEWTIALVVIVNLIVICFPLLDLLGRSNTCTHTHTLFFSSATHNHIKYKSIPELTTINHENQGMKRNQQIKDQTMC
jgi:hypothetical protein